MSYVNGSVSPEQRHTARNRCRVCEGADGDTRGQGKRCNGYASADGEYVHCARAEFAGGIEANGAGLFAHRMHGSCRCGTSHGAAKWNAGNGATAGDVNYDYRTERGAVAYQVVRGIRAGKKSFYQRRPDGAGRWINGRGDVARVLYRLPELVAADPEKPVYVAEGEKDADTLVSRGLTATCNPEGAGKFHYVGDLARRVLAGRDVIVIADADKAGRDHARDVHARLHDVVRSIRVLEPAAPHNDVSDLLCAGGSLSDLIDLGSEERFAEADCTPAAPRFTIWTPEQIWAPLSAPEYAIGGLLLKGNLALLVAYGSSFKSWLEIDLLVAKAAGLSWLGMFPCEPAPVLLIDWESDDWEDRRRMQAVSMARGLVGPVAGVHMITMPALFFTSPDFESTLRELAQTYKLICFDTLSAGSPGIEENDTRFAGGLNILKRIGPATGTTFLVLHHARKGKADGPGDDREAVRGSGAIFAAADVVLQLFKREDGSFLVKQTKARGGKAIDPFVVRVENVANGVSVYGSPADAEAEKEDLGGASALALAKRRVLMVVSAEKDLKSKNAVFRRTKGTKKAVFDAVDDLMENGIVRVHEGAYRLASEVAS